MITSLINLNRVLFKSVFLSKHIEPSAIYNALKCYNGIDWQKQSYKQNNKYEKYYESVIYILSVTPNHYIHKMSQNAIIYNNNMLVKLIKWEPNYEGHFHNHDNHQCYYKVLDGALTETVKNEHIDQLYQRSYTPNMIGYISDNVGQHKITNISNDFSYSLHVYYKSNSNNYDVDYEYRNNKKHITHNKDVIFVNNDDYTDYIKFIYRNNDPIICIPTINTSTHPSLVVPKETSMKTMEVSHHQTQHSEDIEKTLENLS